MKQFTKSMHQLVISLHEIRNVQHDSNAIIQGVKINNFVGYSVHKYDLMMSDKSSKSISVQMFDDDTVGVVIDHSEQPLPASLKELLRTSLNPHS